MRWGLLVVLALCVVLMHHVPAEHDQAHPPAAVATHAAMTTEHAQPPAAAVVMTTEHGESPAAPDHGLLHLCLAVVVGFLAFVVPLLRRASGASAELPKRLVLASLDRFRPPTPVPRRLAVLCVLRR
jgi:hypothetical protein